jgi:hypothetical protein
MHRRRARRAVVPVLTEQVGRERTEQRDAAADGRRRRRTVERQGVSDPSHRYRRTEKGKFSHGLNTD